MTARHNLSVTGPTPLTLSAVDHDPTYPGPHLHDRRLCAPCIAARFVALNPRTRRIRHSPELIAQEIRLHGGNVWPAIITFGISYRHACRIRAGWRPGGQRAVPVPYVSRGWISGQRVGSWTESELRLAWGDR